MKTIEYYFKPTKQCNLRCFYCKEQKYYNNLQVLNSSLMRDIFKKILLFHKNNKIKYKLIFTYSGGEPLILGKKWLNDVLELQRELFGAANIKYDTVIQTNLTLLDQEWIDIFKNYNVQIGTSLDLFAETRPFKGRRVDSTSVVLKKIAMLAENKWGTSAIVVITRQNYKKGKEIYRFMNKVGLNFHAVPLQLDSIKYCPELEITAEEYSRCLIDMANEYLKLKNRIRISNMDSNIRLIKYGYSPACEGLCSECRTCVDGLFIENTGDVYPCDLFLKPEVYLGNIFKDSISKLFKQKNNKQVFKKLARRYEIIKKTCKGCEYLSICNGGCPTFAYNEGDMFSRSKFYCTVNKLLFSHIKKKLVNCNNSNKYDNRLEPWHESI